MDAKVLQAEFEIARSLTCVVQNAEDEIKRLRELKTIHVSISKLMNSVTIYKEEPQVKQSTIVSNFGSSILETIRNELITRCQATILDAKGKLVGLNAINNEAVYPERKDE